MTSATPPTPTPTPPSSAGLGKARTVRYEEPPPSILNMVAQGRIPGTKAETSGATLNANGVQVNAGPQTLDQFRTERLLYSVTVEKKDAATETQRHRGVLLLMRLHSKSDSLAEETRGGLRRESSWPLCLGASVADSSVEEQTLSAGGRGKQS